MKPIKLLVFGATGAVGSEVLRLALADPRVQGLTAPTRRALAAHRKLVNPLVQLAALDNGAPWWTCDAVICALGTTIKVAGSQEAFAAIDRDAPIQIGRLSKAAGAKSYALNSSLGASPRGNFYLRTKAEAEEGLRALGFDSLSIVRPSLIDAEREHSRPGEQFGLMLARTLKPLIPRRYRAVTAQDIARCLLESVFESRPGVRVIESEDIVPSLR